MTDPDDRETADLFESPDDPKPDNVIDITGIIEDDHLTREHGLIKTTAYIKDPEKARKKTGAADRMAKMRERKKAAGLVQVEIPQEFAEAIKSAGWQEWLDAQKAAPPREIIKEVPVEKIVEVPAKLSQEEKACLQAGRELQEFFQRGGWRAHVLAWLIK